MYRYAANRTLLAMRMLICILSATAISRATAFVSSRRCVSSGERFSAFSVFKIGTNDNILGPLPVSSTGTASCPRPFPKTTTVTTALSMKRGNKNNDEKEIDVEDDDVIITFVTSVAGALSSPTPGISNPTLAIGYILAVMLSFLFVNVPFGFILSTFFAFFSWIGRRFVLEDYFDDVDENYNNDQLDTTQSIQEPYDDDDDDYNERPKTDLLAFAGSVICTGLLSPTSSPMDTSAFSVDSTNQQFFSYGVLATVISGGLFLLFLEKSKTLSDDDADISTSSEKQLMDLWDDELRDQTER